MTIKNTKQVSRSTTRESVWASAQAEVSRLMRQVKSNYRVRTRFERLDEVLRALPLSGQKIALLCRRSHNAETYHDRGENGATLFELNLVLGHLKRLGYV